MPGRGPKPFNLARNFARRPVPSQAGPAVPRPNPRHAQHADATDEHPHDARLRQIAEAALRMRGDG